MTATGPSGPPPRTSSASVNVRPSIAGTPSVSNIRPLAQMPSTNCVSPPAARLNRDVLQANTLSKRSRRIADLFPDGIGPRGDTARVRNARARLVREHDQLPRFLHGQRAQDHTVDERKNRGVRADAERQRQDGDEGNNRRGAQRAKGKTDVLHGVVLRPAGSIYEDIRRVNRVAHGGSRA